MECWCHDQPCSRRRAHTGRRPLATPLQRSGTRAGARGTAVLTTAGRGPVRTASTAQGRIPAAPESPTAPTPSTRPGRRRGSPRRPGRTSCAGSCGSSSRGSPALLLPGRGCRAPADVPSPRTPAGARPPRWDNTCSSTGMSGWRDRHDPSLLMMSVRSVSSVWCPGWKPSWNPVAAHDHQTGRMALGVGEGDGHRLGVRFDVLHAEYDRAAGGHVTAAADDRDGADRRCADVQGGGVQQHVVVATAAAHANDEQLRPPAGVDEGLRHRPGEPLGNGGEVGQGPRGDRMRQREDGARMALAGGAALGVGGRVHDPQRRAASAGLPGRPATARRAVSDPSTPTTMGAGCCSSMSPSTSLDEMVRQLCPARAWHRAARAAEAADRFAEVVGPSSATDGHPLLVNRSTMRACHQRRIEAPAPSSALAVPCG